jgi:hypothetical protein
VEGIDRAVDDRAGIRDRKDRGPEEALLQMAGDDEDDADPARRVDPGRAAGTGQAGSPFAITFSISSAKTSTSSSVV